MEPTDKNSSGWNPKYVTGLFLTTIGGLWTFFDYTYYETINDLNNQISAYEKSNEWKLPETLLKINKSVESLNLRIDERNRLNYLELENDKLKLENKDIRSKMMKTEAALNSANEYLQTVVSKHDDFILKRGKSYALTENNLYISAQNVYSTTVEGQFDNEPYTLELGKSKDFSVGNLTCKVVLTSIAYMDNEASFSKSCYDKSKQPKF
ncbi:hypothetical protein M9E57_001267 [Salmonella enterica]|nr:hypothetical protein [Salmonella enterica]